MRSAIPNPNSITLEESAAPLYQRVKQLILGKIRSGEWAEDHKIPSENELVRDLGISRMTIHRALRELTSDGLLTRVHGVGTFVAGAKPQTPMMEVRSIAEEIAERGHAHSFDLITQESARAGAEVAAALELAKGAEVFHTVLVHRENGLPIQLEDRWVSPAAVPGYLEIDLKRELPHAYLSRHAPLSDGEHVIEAVQAAAWEREALEIKKGEPCLLVRRRTWSRGRPVTVARLLYPGSRHRLGGRFHKDDR